MPGGCCHPEDEPIPPRIDSWARGAVPCKPISLVRGEPPSPSPRSSQDDEEEHPGVEEEEQEEEEQGSPVGMQATDNHDAGGREEIVEGDVPRGGRSGRERGDGMAWGGRDADEEGEIMELLTTLSDGDHHGGEEVLAGAGGIGDAIARGRRQEERTFLEVRCSSSMKYSLSVVSLLLLLCRQVVAPHNRHRLWCVVCAMV